ncbi:MAG: DUF2474 family protein [Roseiarcus sp.]
MTPARPLIVRLAWFLGLWAAGVAALGAVALLLRRALG